MNFITVDIDTNGVNPEKDDILQISAVKISDGKICDTFSKLIKPSRPQTEDMEYFTGITNKDLECAENLEDVMKEFIEFSKDCAIVSYDEFEYSFLNYKGFSVNIVIYLREYLKKNYSYLEKYIADAVIISLGLDGELKEQISTPAFYKKPRLFYALKIAVIFLFVAQNGFEL